MSTDYYSVLLRTISGLDPNTDDARRSLYDRARVTVMDAGLSAAETTSERAALEAAIARLEAEMRQAGARPVSMRPAPSPAPSGSTPPARPRSRRPGLLPAIAVLGTAVLMALVSYALWPRSSAPDRSSDRVRASGPKVEDVRSTAGSADPDRAYIFRRQLVYYRTIHPVGTAVIAKSQHYLYLVRPNTAAIRYTIGVGRECANAVGLLFVSNKEWPQNRHSASAAQRSAPSANEERFSAPALALGDTGHRIYGTEPPIKDGNQGCFALANEDIVDLYNRVEVGTRVVIN